MNNNFWYNKFYNIDNNDNFKKFVYEHICQCFDQCIDLKTNEFIAQKNQNVCSQVKNDSNVDETFFDDLIQNAITFFLNNGVLIKEGVKYYINSEKNNLKLTWENIKTLEDIEIKQLLWLFRKLIVDTILRKLLQKYITDNDFKIFSVGSASLTSDYDITLYGNTSDKINIIKEFQIEFKKIFYEDSSIVFDTNIYGKAYISFIDEPFHTKITCGEQTFFYLNESSHDSELMWGLVKYLSDIRTGFGETIFNDIVSFMEKKLNLPHLYNAKMTLVYLRNKDNETTNYGNLFNIEENFINKYDDKLLGISDYISLVNFYGTETYFTRGAFLDIVVNSQMCKKDIIELNEVDYIVSILENAGFFFIHNNKTKYFIRVQKTLSKLIKYFNSYNIITELPEYQDFNNIILQLGESPDLNYCHWIDDNSFNLLKCEKFTIFNQIFKIIYKLLSIYEHNHITDTTIHTFPFFHNFVQKKTIELASPVKTFSPMSK